jgi:hypothetical protein
MAMDTKKYREAPSGLGPLATSWNDKPHRLIYDLCAEIEELQSKMAKLVVYAEHAEYRLKEAKSLQGKYKRLMIRASDEITRLRHVHLPRYEGKIGEPDGSIVQAILKVLR